MVLLELGQPWPKFAPKGQLPLYRRALTPEPEDKEEGKAGVDDLGELAWQPRILPEKYSTGGGASKFPIYFLSLILTSKGDDSDITNFLLFELFVVTLLYA